MYEEIGNIRLAQHLLGKGIFLETPVSGGLKGVLAQVPVTTGAELSEVLKYFEVYAIRPKGDRLEIIMRRR
jgi:hypothetical protein